ncbi:MAG: hypothetical protein A3D35_03265 [Candidatus Staskawiczbacteria bacterium RIFCSPHIGHO2_02_FULL_34_9]|uniref:Four helix bundle protein n=1 Tax=Candidatus Staskawiczbacteria bacterium RIFCSPHIGHO2_02_FULL_34_9 TaxID=1802206 RepID=A0A1G2I577_9BACT|nr:MAG: hypothetical protein A3D35_03265 [Candidatus Staskawiczbacteria bacterium RIFCSPHIGHO2_02_FULL_34_9]
MTQLNFHNNFNSYNAPPQTLPVLEKSKSVYKKWLEVHRNMERTARFGLGNKIDILFLDLLELLRKSVYSPINKKLEILELAIEKVDSLRFFLQLLWEAKFTSNKTYISLASDTEDLGKIIGGWRKGILTKLPPIKAGERKQ